MFFFSLQRMLEFISFQMKYSPHLNTSPFRLTSAHLLRCSDNEIQIFYNKNFMCEKSSIFFLQKKKKSWTTDKQYAGNRIYQKKKNRIFIFQNLSTHSTTIGVVLKLTHFTKMNDEKAINQIWQWVFNVFGQWHKLNIRSILICIHEKFIEFFPYPFYFIFFFFQHEIGQNEIENVNKEKQ